jgi:hypothetical protein
MAHKLHIKSIYITRKEIVMTGREFKYIIVNEVLPHIFSKGQTHAEVAAGLGNVTSAGYGKLHVEDGVLRISAYGKSVALDKKYEEGDEKILEMLFKGAW